MMRFFLSLLLFSVAHIALADTPGDYRHLMPLLPQHEGGQHRLVLPAEVYLLAEQPGLADLRMFNAARESLPFAFFSAPAEPPAKPMQQALNWFALPDSSDGALARGQDVHLTVKLQPDGTLTASRDHALAAATQVNRYLIDASQLNRASQALEIDVADSPDNMLRHLTIEGSDDLRNWRTLADHAPWLSARSGSVQLVQKRVEFSPVRSKYFRLTWNDHPAPLQKVVVETLADNAPAHYLQHTMQIPQRRSASPDYEFELPPALSPERLRLILPQPDSVASVSVSVRGAEYDPWHHISSATFYRISRDSTELSSPSQALPGIRARYWRIHLDRYSSELPSSLQLEIGWRPHQVVFLASGSAPYTLAFGNRQAKAAGFPLTSLLPGYRAGSEQELPLAATGNLVSRDLTVPAASFMDRWREIDWKSLLLWAVLIGGVALLGWMAWHIRKGLEEGR